MRALKMGLGLLLATSLSMGCLPKPKQDYTMEQLKAMESLEEIMRVQASTMDPQFAKIGKQLVEEDFALLSKAATRMQATAEAVVAKHSDKRPAGFKTLAEQFGKQAADLVAAADAKDNKASGELLGKMRETCRGCHKEFR